MQFRERCILLLTELTNFIGQLGTFQVIDSPIRMILILYVYGQIQLILVEMCVGLDLDIVPINKSLRLLECCTSSN